ncbi:MAG: 5'-nucleotidase C-terminal domain-containing protein [Clostridia bacterium]|nr:5'-nucleotidase C-terminal domain-containing protein [Clostridia bacterium]
MKKFIKRLFVCLLALLVLFCGCSCGQSGCRKHKDDDSNGVCDKCFNSVFIYFDFYALGDLANKSADNDKLTNYFKYVNQNDQNTVLLSTGNMWNTADSAVAFWMNESNFAAMTPGIGEFNLGKDSIKTNTELAEFPLLAINVYDRDDDRIADFCAPSTVIESDGIKIGIIGAVGDYYSSIAEKYDDIYFKTGADLTELVKDEADRLHKKGADFIVYMLHIGKEYSEAYYDQSLSDGYVDLVFEGNTNQSYKHEDVHGVYHLQSNEGSAVGISHAEVAFNTVTDTTAVRMTELVSQEVYTQVEYIPQEQETTQNSNGNDNQENSNTTDKPQSADGCKKHTDTDSNGICDKCSNSVIVYIDFYSINDLHGKLADADSHVGVDELTTYLKNARKTDENAIFLSTGDMWQGSSESNMTKGLIMTDWMNELDFAAMAIGNHEYDWGEEYIEDNDDFAEFPFLAINIYDRETNKLVDYCEPSVVVETDGLQIGIIGAIGDCYSSIAVDKCEDVYFKVGSQLTSLVKAEAERLRKDGVDFIVYMLHDGYGNTNLSSVQQISSSQIASYYDTSLSDGYVDLVFEGHTHQGYRLQDEYGVYHLQNRGDNKGGISHAEVAINTVTEQSSVATVELISTTEYQNLADDPIVEQLLDKYEQQILPSNEVLGYNSNRRSSSYMQQLVANLYYETGMKEWGDKYDIALGGGFMSVRSPYNLSSGDVTYADLQSLFPFDNQLTLCSVKGRDLKSKFFETNNDRYFICYGDYGESVRQNIDMNATYYIVVDSYTAYYAPNNLTVVEEYDPNIFARDMLADYIKSGGLS